MAWLLLECTSMRGNDECRACAHAHRHMGYQICVCKVLGRLNFPARQAAGGAPGRSQGGDTRLGQARSKACLPMARSRLSGMRCKSIRIESRQQDV